MRTLKATTDAPADLTAPQKVLAETIVAGGTREEAAAAAGVSIATCYRWTKLPAVQSYMHTLSADLADRTRRKFLAAADKAAERLLAISQGEAPRHAFQLQALTQVLDRGAGLGKASILLEAGQRQGQQAVRITLGYPEGQRPAWADPEPDEGATGGE